MANKLEFIGNAKQLKDIFYAVSQVLDETQILIDKKGLRILIMDLYFISGFIYLKKGHGYI